MEIKWFARAGVGLSVAIVVTVSAVQMRSPRQPAVPAIAEGPVATGTNPLRHELIRCQSIGQAGASDPSCLRAWAENRRRFLAPGARPVEPLPAADAVTPVTAADAQVSANGTVSIAAGTGER